MTQRIVTVFFFNQGSLIIRNRNSVKVAQTKGGLIERI